MNKVHTAYDIAAPCVITPASPLNPLALLVSYSPQTEGSAGVITFNDCLTLEEVSIENQIFSAPYDAAYSSAAPGTQLNMPISKWLVVSAVPTGSVYTVQYAVYVPG